MALCISVPPRAAATHTRWQGRTGQAGRRQQLSVASKLTKLGGELFVAAGGARGQCAAGQAPMPCAWWLFADCTALRCTPHRPRRAPCAQVKSSWLWLFTRSLLPTPALVAAPHSPHLARQTTHMPRSSLLTVGRARMSTFSKSRNVILGGCTCGAGPGSGRGRWALAGSCTAGKRSRARDRTACASSQARRHARYTTP